MRRLLVLILCLVGRVACAQQTPVDGYYADFDRARAMLNREVAKYPHATKEQQGELDALHDRLSRDLDTTMRRLVGPLSAPDGFAGNGKWNRDLWPGLGSDRLDGIRFLTGGANGPWSEVLVTTDELLSKWVARYQ